MYSTLKRILIGPPIASTEEHHQRLIKIIALAVFASDAISSTAYATEEILLVLVPAGRVDAFKYLVPISLIVVVAAGHRRHQLPPDDLRLPERRRLLRRVAGEPRDDAGARGRLVAARRLRPHRGRVDLGRRRRHHLGVRRAAPVPRRDLPRLPRPHDAGQPARPEGVGAALRRPDLPLRLLAARPDRCRALPGRSSSDLGAIPDQEEYLARAHRARPDARPDHALPAHAGVLVGCRRPVRRRGHLQRRARRSRSPSRATPPAP